MDGVTTRTLMGSAYPQPGLYSKFFDVDMDPLVQVVQDTVGRHDTFGLACTRRYYEDMGYPGHVNCTDNFNVEVDPYGIAPRAGWEAVNFFFNTRIEADNVLVSDEPWSRPGDYVMVRALTDLVCASSACPDDIDPANAWECTDIHVRVYSPENRFQAAIAHRVTPEAEPVMTKETAFHPRTSELTESFLEYRGYWLPHCFNNEGAIGEYWACREKAVVMDLSPLRKWEVLGPDAETLIQAAVTRDARRLAVGQVVYTAMCNETGGMIDDATVFRLGDDNFRFVGGDEYDGVWLKELGERLGLKAFVKPSTDQLHNVAVQGPNSREIMKELIWTPPTQPPLDELKWFRFLVGRIGGYQGIPVVVSRTGYTGELGYEVFCHPDDGVAVWDAIWEAGQPHGLKPLGLEALDMIRIEAGLIFAGYEFDDQVDPVRGRHRLHGEARLGGRLRRQGRADRALRAPAAQARRARARGQRDGRARRRGVRRAPARGRGHERDALADAAEEHRAVPDVRAVRGERDGRGGRQARRAAEADPGAGGRVPVLRPEEGAPAVVSTPERPAEFNFPISFTGPDGIGASPFDEYAEAERPDVARRRSGPRGRASPDARHVRHGGHGDHRAEGRAGARHDRQRVHVRLARAAAGPHLGRPADEDVRPAPRGNALRRQRSLRDPGGSLRPVRRPLGRGRNRASSSSGTRRSWTARSRTSWRASSGRTGAATTRCSSGASSTRARTPARRCSSTAAGTRSSVPRAIVVGVVGDSGAGKTTITRGLTRVIGDAHVTHVSADDYHRFDRRQRRELGVTPAASRLEPPRHPHPARRAPPPRASRC